MVKGREGAVLPLRGVWLVARPECAWALAGAQTCRDSSAGPWFLSQRQSTHADPPMLQFSITPAGADCCCPGTPQPAGSRSGLGEAMSGPKWSGGEPGQAGAFPSVPSSGEQPLISGLTSLSASGRSSWDTATAAQFHGSHATTR